ncbi:MAG: hypothetical protein F4X22_02820 [Gemmatimonadales bacterium]|nr:hypothetical protein [Candidatus Palauibacter denitrificans]
MRERDVVRRLVAHAEGRPLPRGTTRQLHVAADEDLLIVAFVRMGGESRPWGIAFGRPGAEPELLTVPEGRNRDLVADMCSRFAPALLRHLRTPGFVDVPPTEAEELRPLRQVWLPNGSHADMLHHLAYAYTFTQWRPEGATTLNPLGRAAGWLFREAQRPGQQHVVTATEALRTSYTFPAQSTRLEHLGFLLTWLDPDVAPGERFAAAHEAEALAVSTALDPVLERSRIEKPLDDWHDARNEGDARRERARASEIARVLEEELRRRYRLTAQAISHLRADGRRTNRGVGRLIDAALEEQWHEHTQPELRHAAGADPPPFTPSPETDRDAAAAGARYMAHLASASLAEAVLLHDDEELQDEAIARGDGFRGTIADVEDRSRGRWMRTAWTVRDENPGPLRLREGSWVSIIGSPERRGTILAVRTGSDGRRTFEVEVSGHVTWPVGSEVGFVESSNHQLSQRKSQLIWSDDEPGSWLTHARPDDDEGRR